VQVPPTQQTPGAQQVGVPWNPQIRLVGQHVPPTFTWPGGQHSPVEQVVPLAQQRMVAPLAHTCPAVQQVVPLRQTRPVAQQVAPQGTVAPLVGTQLAVAPLLQLTVPEGQTQPVQAALGTVPPLQARQVVPPALVQATVPVGQAQVHPLVKVAGGVQAGTQLVLPVMALVQVVVPLGQAHTPK
jgi:hypothetical protein